MATSKGDNDIFITSTAAEQLLAKPLIAPPPLPQSRICVTVPVRNESENLEKSLHSIVNQVDFDGRPLDPRTFEVIVLVNNSADDSAAIARRMRQKPNVPPIHVVEIDLPAEHANVGTARRIVMDEANARFARRSSTGGVIATTDGDTCVAPTWIAATLKEIARGAEAVSGRIVIDENELARLDAQTRRFHLLDVGYRHAVAELESYLDPLAHDPFPRHHQHFNASFAVTTAAYRRAGGVPRVPFLEDFAFYQALLRVDARFRHSPLVRVTTSARRKGRTARGLSTQLADWETMGATHEKYLVESLPELEAKFRARRLLRTIWQNAALGLRPDFWELNALADEYGIAQKALENEILRAQTFGALCEQIESETKDFWRARFKFVPIETALFDLRLRLAPLRAVRAQLASKLHVHKHRADIAPPIVHKRAATAALSAV